MTLLNDFAPVPTAVLQFSNLFRGWVWGLASSHVGLYFITFFPVSAFFFLLGFVIPFLILGLKVLGLAKRRMPRYFIAPAGFNFEKLTRAQKRGTPHDKVTE